MKKCFFLYISEQLFLSYCPTNANFCHFFNFSVYCRAYKLKHNLERGSDLIFRSNCDDLELIMLWLHRVTLGNWEFCSGTMATVTVMPLARYCVTRVNDCLEKSEAQQMKVQSHRRDLTNRYHQTHELPL